MKKIGFLLAVLVLISCQDKKPVDYTLISGSILNKVGGEIKISNSDGSLKKEIKVADDGSFKDTLNFGTGYFYLVSAKQSAQIYLENGSEIYINFDANDFNKTLVFSGKGSEISSYILNKNRIISELKGDRTEFYALDEKAYKTKLVEMKLGSEELLNMSNGLSESFKEKELRNINYAYLEQLAIYGRYHAHYAKLPDFKISEDFLGELASLKYDNEDDFDFSKAYKKLVELQYRKEAAELVKLDSMPEDVAYLKMVNSGSSEVIKNELLFNAAKYEITYTDNLEDYYAAFVDGSTNEKNNSVITESYNALKALSKGNKSPKFNEYENFKGGKTSLDELKGKYVYIDVWATWCGPCKAEIPALKKLEEKYHGKNIEFVSVSVDALKDKDKWKAMVTEKEMGGVQLFADKSWESDFVQDYLIKGIPRFILIDAEGNIISANAPRPSSPKIIDLFNEFNI